MVDKYEQWEEEADKRTQNPLNQKNVYQLFKNNMKVEI